MMTQHRRFRGIIAQETIDDVRAWDGSAW